MRFLALAEIAHFKARISVHGPPEGNGRTLHLKQGESPRHRVCRGTLQVQSQQNSNRILLELQWPFQSARPYFVWDPTRLKDTTASHLLGHDEVSGDLSADSSLRTSVPK